MAKRMIKPLSEWWRYRFWRWMSTWTTARLFKVQAKYEATRSKVMRAKLEDPKLSPSERAARAQDLALAEQLFSGKGGRTDFDF